MINLWIVVVNLSLDQIKKISCFSSPIHGLETREGALKTNTLSVLHTTVDPH